MSTVVSFNTYSVTVGKRVQVRGQEGVVRNAFWTCPAKLTSPPVATAVVATASGELRVPAILVADAVRS